MRDQTPNCWLAVFLFFVPLSLFSQHQCGFDELHQHLLATDIDYRQRLKSNERQLNDWLENAAGVSRNPDEVYTIPVVVHVVYADEEAIHNISDDQVESAIQRLNDILNNHEGQGLSANIEFCLAQRDPFCHPTNGIVRVDGSGVADYSTEGIDPQVTDTDGIGANRLQVLSLSRWNPSEYLNIWVVNEINNNNGSYGIQAFAGFPGTNPLYDGVVILYNALGFDYDNCNCFALKPFTSEGEVLAHEIGHYLNLYHTFEGDGGGIACPDTTGTAGDRVSDTPAHIRTYSCSSLPNSCYPVGHPFENLSLAAENYMGYADEACQASFTEGQILRMRATLNTSRSSLLGSFGCQPLPPVEVAAPSCMPQTSLGLQGEYGMGITKVQIGEFHSASGTSYQDGGYRNNYCQIIELRPDTTYDLEIRTFGFQKEDLSIFIDFNNDGDLSADEQVFYGNSQTVHTGFFSTPIEVLQDTPLRLRIISDHFQFNISSGCYAPKYGQVEDYTVLFPSPPVPDPGRGQALYLDGNGADLETDIAFEVAEQPFTIEFWCKPMGDPADLQVVFDKTKADFSSTFFMVLWHKKLFTFRGTEVLFMNPGQSIEKDTWHHLAYTWDGTVQRVYLNGQLSGQDTVSSVVPNDEPFVLGSLLKNFYTFHGEIDELRFWQEARTAQQLREGMHLVPEINELPDAWFRFNGLTPGMGENNGAYVAIPAPNATSNQSTVNMGAQGSSHSINGIESLGIQQFSDAELSMDFLEKTTKSDFTVTLQQFPPNTTEGIGQATLFSDCTWTVTTSIPDDFSALLTFKFAEGTLTGSADQYLLYHRSAVSDGAWELLSSGAAELTPNSVSFEGISVSGQFLVVKD